MAPRAPKSKIATEDVSATPSPLKPRTEKAKVEKVKVDKSKAEKAPKTTKAKTAKAKTLTIDDDGEEHDEPSQVVKPKAVAKKTEKDGPGSKDTKVKDTKDGKEKVKAVNGEEAISLMTNYLKEQNRPYSATEISANLHGKVTKTVADKLLKEMEQSGLIMAKATNGTNKGSQWVFWAKQDAADAASPEELAAMDTAIKSTRENLPDLKATFKAISLKLQTLRSSPTTAQLTSMIETLRAENQKKQEKLACFKDGSIKMVTKEEMDKVEKDFKYWGGKRKARMTAYQNLEGQLLDGGMTKDEIEEKVGVEPDTYDA